MGKRKAVELYCLCRMPERGFMICCDRCDEWFHGSCVGVKHSSTTDNDKWYCKDCMERSHFRKLEEKVGKLQQDNKQLIVEFNMLKVNLEVSNEKIKKSEEMIKDLIALCQKTVDNKHETPHQQSKAATEETNIKEKIKMLEKNNNQSEEMTKNLIIALCLNSEETSHQQSRAATKETNLNGKIKMLEKKNNQSEEIIKNLIIALCQSSEETSNQQSKAATKEINLKKNNQSEEIAKKLRIDLCQNSESYLKSKLKSSEDQVKILQEKVKSLGRRGKLSLNNRPHASQT